MQCERTSLGSKTLLNHTLHPRPTRRTTAIEPLESRRLLAGVYIQDRVLFVDGTDSADEIRTEGGYGEEDTVEVVLNGVTSTASKNDFDRILVRGFAGNDTLHDRVNAPLTFEGGDGNDFMETESDDGKLAGRMVGGAGDDVYQHVFGPHVPFDGGAGRDTYVLFTGNTLDLRQSPTVEDAEVQNGGHLIGNALNNTLRIFGEGGRIEGGDGNDTLDGSNAFGADLFGGNGNDRLIGGGSDGVSHDTLEGQAGHDTLVSGPGREVLSGGSGLDTVDYSSRTFNLGITIDGVANDGAVAAGGDPGEGDNVWTDVETVLAGSGNDWVFGNGLNNLFRGNGGNDFLGGFGGNDALYGGAGNDRLEGGNGNDYLEGNSGNDALLGEVGTDFFAAGDGDDWLYSRDSISEHVNGGNGFDRAQRDASDNVISIEAFLA